MSGFEARGKWDAWEAKKGMSKEDAAKEYVSLVKGVLGEWNNDGFEHKQPII